MATKKATKKKTAKKAAKKTSKRGSKKTTAKKTYPTKSGGRSKTPPSKRWSSKVTTDSTHPDEGLFTKSAPEIARALASKKVSPEGPGQGMRMLAFYINRAGKNLSAERKATLNHAKEILRGIEEKKGSTRKAAGKTAGKSGK
jgi:tRNA(adenine34) deaminase